MSQASGVNVSPATTLSGGFTDPVLSSQSAFRKLLDAMSRPGTVHRFDTELAAPSPLASAAGIVLLALSDQDTGIWFDGGFDQNGGLAQWIAFHCGSPVLDEPYEADFAVISQTGSMPQVTSFKRGTQEYPDRSATLILQCGMLSDSEREGLESLVLEGPGIKARNHLFVENLPRDFSGQWAQMKPKFPLGVDLILAGTDALGVPAIACLPRTARIVSEGA